MAGAFTRAGIPVIVQRSPIADVFTEAAFDLAMSSGFANVRVPEIVLTVGVTTRTFNKYFVSKQRRPCGRRPEGRPEG